MRSCEQVKLWRTENYTDSGVGGSEVFIREPPGALSAFQDKTDHSIGLGSWTGSLSWQWSYHPHRIASLMTGFTCLFSTMWHTNVTYVSYQAFMSSGPQSCVMEPAFIVKPAPDKSGLFLLILQMCVQIFPCCAFNSWPSGYCNISTEIRKVHLLCLSFFISLDPLSPPLCHPLMPLSLSPQIFFCFWKRKNAFSVILVHNTMKYNENNVNTNNLVLHGWVHVYF